MTELFGQYTKELERNMASENKIRKLEERKLKIVRRIQASFHYKFKVEKLAKQLKEKHRKGLLSYEEYKERLERALERKTVKQWQQYYDKSIECYRKELTTILEFTLPSDIKPGDYRIEVIIDGKKSLAWFIVEGKETEKDKNEWMIYILAPIVLLFMISIFLYNRKLNKVIKHIKKAHAEDFIKRGKLHIILAFILN